MKLRTQILLFLFIFGFAPLTTMVATSLPFVLDRLELFYHKAHLQNLRADFRDLDEHLASRHEVVRLLAKLPEPSLVLEKELKSDDETIDQARARYTSWVNQILMGHLDIIQILFLDAQGKPRFWLELNPRTQQWEPTIHNPDMPSKAFFRNAQKQEFGGVAVSKISLDSEAALKDMRRFMTLRLISTIAGRDENSLRVPIGAVVVNIDVGGMARAYRNTLWVTNDGSYLTERLAGNKNPAAFDDFPGLEQIFSEGKLSLWEDAGKQVIWVPLFMTEDSGPLWVGRAVDPSPVSQFRNNLIIRVLTVAIVALVIVLLSARWIAMNIERFGRSLTGQIGRVMRENEAVRFDWKGPHEIQDLGRKLTSLAETHARHANEQLEHAKQLEESNRYKSEFLANVSHELRTPLNSILLLSKIMQEAGVNSLSEEQKQQLRVIHEAGVDLKELIENILDLSKIEAGKAIFSYDLIEIRDLISELMELIKPQFDAKGLQLVADYSADIPQSFVSDLAKLRQILKNFLSNALKFTHQGGVTIKVSMREGAHSCPLLFSVTDTGIGIAPAKQEIIFDAFKQADGSTNRLYGGTGLGLSISRELAHLLGGFIELQSAEGKGSTFTLFLPLDTDRQKLTSYADTQIQMPDQEATDSVLLKHPGMAAPKLMDEKSAEFVGKRVLVVDDDLRNLLSLTPLLEDWGFEVTAAGDGKEALETLAEDAEYSCILMDIMMPEMDGCDTIRAIRNDVRLHGLTVIALSANSSGENRNLCMQAGADAFISKPIEANELKTLIKNHLDV